MARLKMTKEARVARARRQLASAIKLARLAQQELRADKRAALLTAAIARNTLNSAIRCLQQAQDMTS